MNYLQQKYRRRERTLMSKPTVKKRQERERNGMKALRWEKFAGRAQSNLGDCYQKKRDPIGGKKNWDDREGRT